MKQCPTCNKAYDDSLKFCLADGTALSTVYESTGIHLQSNSDEQNMNSRQRLKPTYLYVASAAVFLLIGILLSLLIRFDSSIFTNAKGKIPANDSDSAAPQTSNGIELSRNIAYSPSQVANNISSNSTPLTTISAPNTEGIKRDISDRINSWKKASEARDLNLYMQSYAETVDYYKKMSASKSFVRNDKQRAFSKFDSISLKVDIVSIAPDSSGNQADVLVDKEWLFQGGGYLSGKVRQRLQFRMIGGEWLITGEKDLKVYYVNK